MTYVYSYDNAGNLTSKKTYGLTAGGTTPTNHTDEEIYTYGNENWGDQLTAYNGAPIVYDSLGNPTSYYNGATFGWVGRRLTSASKSGNSYTFVYDSDGIRTEKTVNGVKHTYRYIDGRLHSEEWGNHLMVFLYNDMGVPIGMRYRTSSYSANVWDTYWYERNLQGDITAIYNASGTKLVSYKYDAWGNHTPAYSNGGASIVPIVNNPLRYRGYYYDADLGLYYLQSRYYDSNTGRFINADGYISTGTGILGYNMYAYCNNNPVMYVDPYGTDAILITLFGNGGLQIVGHSALFVEYDNKWHFIQYAGGSKPEAAVEVSPLDEESYNTPYDYIESCYDSNYWATELAGDYSGSYEYANNLKGTDLGGYNLVTNNCSHFVADTMNAGQSDNDLTEWIHSNIRSTVPVITHILTGAANYIGDKYREFEEWMGWST